MDVWGVKELHRKVRGKIHLFIFLERKYRVGKLTSGLLKRKLIFKSAKSSQEWEKVVKYQCTLDKSLAIYSKKKESKPSFYYNRELML